MTDYKQSVFDNVYGFDDWIWAGLRSYPWVEFGSLVERKQGCIICGARPRKTGSRLATELDRQRLTPDPELLAWRSRILKGGPSLVNAMRRSFDFLEFLGGLRVN
jgi:hypothetical protein